MDKFKQDENSRSATISDIMETSSVCLQCVRFQMELTQDAAEDTQAQAGKVGREQAIHGCGRTNWEQAFVNSKFYSWCSGCEVLCHYAWHPKWLASTKTAMQVTWRIHLPCRQSGEDEAMKVNDIGKSDQAWQVQSFCWIIAGGYKWHIGIFWGPRQREWDNWDNSYNLMVSLCILV